MSECGKMINKKGTVVKHGRTDPNMKENFYKAKNMEKVCHYLKNLIKENTIGAMARFIQETGMKTRYQVTGFINGWMEDALKENGSIIVCMGMGNILGLMGVDMLEDTYKIKKRERVNMFG